MVKVDAHYHLAHLGTPGFQSAIGVFSSWGWDGLPMIPEPGTSKALS